MTIGHAQTIRFVDNAGDRIGTVSPADAGLSDQLWQGSTPERLAAAIAGLPRWVASPAQHRALVKLLSVAAPNPLGEPVTPSLASLRMAALAQLGAEQTVLQLEERVPADLRDAPYWNALGSVRILRHDLAGSCSLGVRATAMADHPDWQRLRAFCRWVLGQEEEALVAVIMGSELGEDDPIFAALFLAQEFPERGIAEPIIPTKPLHVLMQRALNAPLGAVTWPAVDGRIAAGLARFPALDIAVRTQAAERAVAVNTLPAELLVQLYLATELTSPTGILYRQAAYAPELAGRLGALQEFWQASQKAGLYSQLAPFTLGYLSGLDLASVPPAFAGDALRAALTSGDLARAGAWQDTLLAASLRPDGASVRDAAYPVLAIAGQPVPPADIWWPAWKKAAKPSARDQALVAGLVRALGMPVGNAPLPKTDTSAAGRAIAGAPMGEGALLALSALASVKNPSDGLAVQAVGAIGRVSLPDARAIALEMVIRRGL